MNEQGIQKKISDTLKAAGCFVFKAIQCNVSGIPDILCCAPYVITPDDVGRKVGLFVGIEVKTSRGVVSPIQYHRLAQIQAAGGIRVVARAVGDAEAALPHLFK